MSIDAIDRAIIRATQAGLALVPRPYDVVAKSIGIPPAEVMMRVAGMLKSGVIRRIGAVPNHLALGLTANAMTVWDVEDTALQDLGPAVGALDFVSHCYHRPRRPPDWRFNLFAMVHGRSRGEVIEKVDVIARLLAGRCRAHDVLFSRRILKKTGLRLAA
jgi:DNA-binding Lrp family transcriptional regulator